MKKIIFVLFSQDYEKEYDRIHGIQNFMLQIREIFVFYINLNHSLEDIFPKVEEDIDKIIYNLSSPSYIKFENDINSIIYNELINMVINELNYIKIINKDIFYSEYGRIHIFHELDNAIDLCTIIKIMITLSITNNFDLSSPIVHEY